MSEQTKERLRLPVLPLRDLVLFPGVTAPVGAGRPGTLRAIETAVNTEDRLVFAVSQRENVEAVDPEILHTIGVVAKIGQMQRGLGGIQLLLHGEYRATVLQYNKKADHIVAIVQEALDLQPIDPADAAFAALYKELRERAAELGEKTGISADTVQQVLQTVS
ncbi:MAG: LON peptidase substrate-binding domain-containing protein, partial [Gemmatimonadetes bacterium]|nr:LON peptidase substrate-binding domain-containing protein [Gemmatimonadota bacterium]